MFRVRSTAFVIVFISLTTTSIGLAQSGPTGTIIGTVTDTSGAIIPNAKVTIANVATNVSQETVTSSTGTYSVPFLIPGTYKVTVAGPGFSTGVISGIMVAVGKEVAVDVQLKPGAVTESVTVTASSVALDTANAAMGQVITESQVLDLPLNGRNFTQLLLLGAGAVQSSGEQGSFRRNVGNSLTIQGAHPGSNSFMLDGISINDAYYQTPAVVPSIDALQEFHEQTKGYSAAYGFGANQINLTTKSGTNALHGTVYDFLRNDALDARSFFDTTTLPLRQNQFGYTLGGPVWIPKVYNGKDKTFFFANYEGLRTRTSFTGFGIVPTTAELSGVFSTTIINPVTHQPYPDNTIPQSDFSVFGKSAVKHFPAPNVELPQGNYRYTASEPADADQQTYRIDHSIGSRNSIFGRYTQTRYKIAAPGITVEGTTHQDQPTHQVVVSYTRTFNPTVVNQVRFGWMDAKAYIRGEATSESEWSALGLKGTFPYDSTLTTYPNIGWMNIGLSGVGGPGYSPNDFAQRSYQISDTLSLVKGSHNISTGIDIHRLKHYVNTFSSPKFVFDGSLTGHPVADMLLGYAFSANASVPTQFATSMTEANTNDMRYLRVAPWVQDDWKVNPRLTVNLGLRWDFMPRPQDARGNLFWVDSSRPGGGLYVANKSIIDQGIGDDLYKYGGDSPGTTQWRVFAPRFGIAFRPSRSQKTVVRASFGMFYDSYETKEAFAGGQYPFAEQSVSYNVPINGLFPSIPAAHPVTSADLGFVWASNPLQSPYMEMWTVSLQHQLPRGVKLEAAYLGSAGHHLVGRTWANAPTPYDPANPSPASARFPYPNLGLILDHPFAFNSNYNALNFQAEHRGKSLTLLAAYTWSHSLDVRSGATGINNELSWNGPMNQYNWRLDYGNSAFDVTHRFVGSFVYALPFGKGQAIYGNASGPVDVLIGGWQVNGILTFQSGFPFSVSADDIDFLNYGFAQRADLVGNPHLSGSQRSITKWFNTAAFAQPALGTFGNSGRNILRAPGIENLDFSLFKNISLGEQVRLQTRFEAFNLLNHANFGAPTSYVNSSAFGVIGSASPGRIVQIAMKLIW
jgi:hypothetical protein